MPRFSTATHPRSCRGSPDAFSRERRLRSIPSVRDRLGPVGRMLLGGSRAGLVDEPLARYRLRRSSLSADRVALLEGRCRVLERAASREDLTPDERTHVRRALAREQRNALLTRTSIALRKRSPEARELAIRVARTQSLPPGTRAKAALAALAPGAASRRLVNALDQTGVGGPAACVFRSAAPKPPSAYGGRLAPQIAGPTSPVPLASLPLNGEAAPL